MRLTTAGAIAVLSVSCVSATSAQENPYLEFRAETYQLQLDYLRVAAEHQGAVMGDLEAKLEQQRWQTNAIAIMVFVLVGAGLCLSFLQFRRDGDTDSKSSFSLELGAGKLQLNSSVIGLIILVLSIWFFQTYIDRVYEIQVFDLPAVDMTQFGVNG